MEVITADGNKCSTQQKLKTRFKVLNRICIQLSPAVLRLPTVSFFGHKSFTSKIQRSTKHMEKLGKRPFALQHPGEGKQLVHWSAATTLVFQFEVPQPTRLSSPACEWRNLPICPASHLGFCQVRVDRTNWLFVGLMDFWQMTCLTMFGKDFRICFPYSESMVGLLSWDLLMTQHWCDVKICGNLNFTLDMVAMTEINCMVGGLNPSSNCPLVPTQGTLPYVAHNVSISASCMATANRCCVIGWMRDWKTLEDTMEVLKGCEVVEVLWGGCQVWWSRWPRVGIQEDRDHFLLHQTSVWWAERADTHLLITFWLVYLHSVGLVMDASPTGLVASTTVQLNSAALTKNSATTEHETPRCITAYMQNYRVVPLSDC